MIGLILGTSEGKSILSLLNKFTKDILISTATEYGGELLQNYKYAYLNTKPLNLEGLKELFKKKGIRILVDASHPYAVEITDNAIKACSELNIEYVRYERASCVDKFKDHEKVIEVENYEGLYDKLKYIKGNILNTSGSRNLDKILSLNIENRIVHRVLPSVKVMDECLSKGVKIDDIIAIKGPISYNLNCAFIKEYEAKAMILKDSGIQGGTEEKIKACVDNDIYAFIIERNTRKYKTIFYDEENLVQYIIEKLKSTKTKM
ncbi:cobalt-precorrin-6A reductase [Clostridium scatologenes]|uniref:Precorrin-6x reductase n=1 Tax=Clostridium scatologenes TaxID=1548 RepID=A0A0E3GSJ9_CLOSL|nr:cobalt-precorrin-6A reductase [Clostridium scatologenes]AKA72201.1 precorrin-6x reductase [Clostridium scatologenes]